MAKQKFKINWRDPETDELCSVIKDFDGDDAMSALEWASDWAYSRADKGWYRIEEIKA